MPEDDLLSVADIYAVHEEVVDRWELTYAGTRGPLPDQRLQTIIEDAHEETDPYVFAGTLLRNLATAHVFEDGNKRTSWVVAKTVLRERGKTVAPSGQRIATVMKHLKRYDVDELATWLETGQIDDSRFRHASDE